MNRRNTAIALGVSATTSFAPLCLREPCAPDAAEVHQHVPILIKGGDVTFDWPAVQRALEMAEFATESIVYGTHEWWIATIIRVAHAAYLEGKNR